MGPLTGRVLGVGILEKSNRAGRQAGLCRVWTAHGVGVQPAADHLAGRPGGSLRILVLEQESWFS